MTYTSDTRSETKEGKTMADIIDQGNETAEVFLDAALSHRRPLGPRPNGRCHNCGEKVKGNARWCDADCRDDDESRG